MNATGIEWTHKPGYKGLTWNPITGCRHNCGYCYARRIANRFPAAFPQGFEPTFHEKRLVEPSRRRKPAFIFTVSMGDLFGSWVPIEWIDEVLVSIEESPQHIFVLLTKNPRRMKQYSEYRPFPRNVWAGATVTTHEEARAARWHLNDTDCHLRYMSVEPIRGPITQHSTMGMDWLIVGSESGSHAPKPNLDHVRTVISIGEMTGVPVFVKANTGLPGPREWPDERHP